MAKRQEGKWTLEGNLDGITDVQRDDANNKITIALNENNSRTRTFTVKYEDNGKCGKKTITQAGGSSPSTGNLKHFPITLNIHNDLPSEITLTQILFILENPDTNGNYHGVNEERECEECPISAYTTYEGAYNRTDKFDFNYTLRGGGTKNGITIDFSWDDAVYPKGGYSKNSPDDFVIEKGTGGLGFRKTTSRADVNKFGVMLYKGTNSYSKTSIVPQGVDKNSKTSFEFEENGTYDVYIMGLLE